MRRTSLALLALLPGLALAGVGEPAPSAAPGGAPTPGALPPVTLTDGAGAPVDLSAFHGKVVVLDAWASWCGPCREELPRLDALDARLPDGAEVVAVSLDGVAARAKALAAHLDLSHATLLYDPEGRIGAALAPPSMPTTWVIDRDGVVRSTHAGALDDGELAAIEAEVRGLLAP